MRASFEEGDVVFVSLKRMGWLFNTQDHFSQHSLLRVA